ncbi:MAG TPA: ribonuclease HII [Acidimicrobiia bacterium]|nr:ribonuclease HII [Acidimicrobiia bacterium]
MSPNLVKPPPTLDTERQLLLEGFRTIGGVDEVGVGAMAGPIVAGCVVLPLPAVTPGLDADLERVASALEGVKDSGHTPRRFRSGFDSRIRRFAAVGIGVVDVGEIDSIGSHTVAVELATARAVKELAVTPDVVMLDGLAANSMLEQPVRRVPKHPLGGTPSLSIAAASIVIDVFRRGLMTEYADSYPGYGFDKHFGYPNDVHVANVVRLGPSPIHHRSHRLVIEATFKK